MSPDDMSSLHDAYQLVDETSASKQTSYILQFLWRDLTSSFDIVGPYFTSSSQLESKFIVSCVLKSLWVFHLYGFHTFCLVCDGASANISALKSTCGTSGAYGVGSTSTDQHKVEPYFPILTTKSFGWFAQVIKWVSEYVYVCVCVCVCVCVFYAVCAGWVTCIHTDTEYFKHYSSGHDPNH